MLISECCKILNVTSNTSLKDIKKAYRLKAKQCHPDVSIKPNENSFHLATTAYNTLKNRYKIKSVKNEYKVKNVKGFMNLDSLAFLLTKGYNPEIRKRAAKLLGNTGLRSAYRYLKNGLYDSDESVVLNTIESVCKLQIRQAVSDLSVVFHNGNFRIKNAILKNIMVKDKLSNYKLLVFSGINDSNPVIRKLARNILEQIG